MTTQVLTEETTAARAVCVGDTLVEALRLRAEEQPDAKHLLLPATGDQPEERLNPGRLYAEAQAVARGLIGRGIQKGDTVALMLPTGSDFFIGFLGILAAGAVPVPIYPPVRIDQLEDYAERQVTILRNASARALITVRQAEGLARLLRPKVKSLQFISRTDELLAEGMRDKREIHVEITPEDLGLIQYTSGSTGDPKGVTLTHANLIANVKAIGEAISVRQDDVVVSWLPLYHDMGLIGCWLFSLCHGLEMICFSPLDFLRRPKRWLRALSDYGGALSPAPNFAYELCLRRIRDRDLEGIDLSTWRWAMNGAEPINPETLERFIERFGPYGFRPEALKPVYGLAENAVAVTFPDSAAPPHIDRIDRELFQREHRAVPLVDGEASDTEPLRFVSVGRPIPENEVRLVDESDNPIPERIEGHIQFRSPSTTPGYYRNPKATAAIRTSDGWTRSGDRGYVADGNLYITGRDKDMIIKAGRNIHPAEVENAASDVDGIRRGCVAAFGVANPKTGSESLVVIAETRKKDPEVLKKLAAEVNRQVSSVIHVSPDVVECVPPHSVPKTPSGKLRRAETQRRYLEGNLRPSWKPVWYQMMRLGAAAGGAYVLSLLWKRSQRD